MSDMKKLETESAKVTGVDGTGVVGSPFTATASAIDRIEDLEHNLTVANTKMDAIIEGTDASLKQLTEMYADAVEQQGEFNKELNRRNQNTNKRISQLKKEHGENIVFIEHRLSANIENVAALSDRVGGMDTYYGKEHVLITARVDDIYRALAVILGLLVLLIVVVGYLLFAGA